MTATKRTIAAFDLDRTLTRRDTLLPFLRGVSGRSRAFRAVVVHSPLMAPALVSRRHRDRAKAAVLATLLKGQDRSAVARKAEAFAAEVVHRRLRPGVLDQLRYHHRAGHELVLVSASPEVYVGPIGRLLGFHAVLATRLEVGPDGCLTGRIEGLNCRGPEKVARLEAWTGGAPVTVYAYGDSAGDLDLLARADTAFRLRRGRRRFPGSQRLPGSDVVADDPGVRVHR